VLCSDQTKGTIFDILGKVDNPLASGGLGESSSYDEPPAHAADGIAMAYAPEPLPSTLQYITNSPNRAACAGRDFLIQRRYVEKAARRLDAPCKEEFIAAVPSAARSPPVTLRRASYQTDARSGETLSLLDITHKTADLLREAFSKH